METLAVLITCHNRKDKTINCLTSLYDEIKYLKDTIKTDVFLVDDGSTDGTPEAIEINFPAVHIIPGNGHLYWNQGMYLAWETASRFKYDFYLWLNDDVCILPFGLSTLLQDSREFMDKSIICGACEANDGSVSYSGYIQKSKILIPVGRPIRCDYFNGNMVLVPKHVFNKLGNLDPVFHHGQGDFDYGLRAKKVGIHSYLSSIVTGECERSSTLPVWCNPAFSIHERYRAFKSPLGGRPRTTFIFQYRHLGLMPALFHYFTIYLRLFFPEQYNRKKTLKTKERIKNFYF